MLKFVSKYKTSYNSLVKEYVTTESDLNEEVTTDFKCVAPQYSNYNQVLSSHNRNYRNRAEVTYGE